MIIYITCDCQIVESETSISAVDYYKAIYVAENGKVTKNRFGPVDIDDTPELRQSVINRWKKN